MLCYEWQCAAWVVALSAERHPRQQHPGWGSMRNPPKPVAAYEANCELRAARLRANVALRSPASVPFAILAAC